MDDHCSQCDRQERTGPIDVAQGSILVRGDGNSQFVTQFRPVYGFVTMGTVTVTPERQPRICPDERYDSRCPENAE